MAPKRKQYGRSADDAFEQGRPAQRARHASRSPSRARSQGARSAKAKVDEISPKIRIPMILHYLQDNDIDHTASWSSELEEIIAYLEYADELRRNGHKDFDENLQGDLFDCQVMISVHRNYEKRNRGKTPYSETKLPLAKHQSRLSWYDRLLPVSKKTAATKRISLIPREGARNSSPFHLIGGKNCDSQLYEMYFKTSGGQRLVQNLTILHRDESLLWQQAPTTKPNLAELENSVYEECVTSRDNLVKNSQFNSPSSQKDEDVSVEDAVRQRGWRRAALQQLLQLFDNQENRAVNTPWRRVALPTPVKQRKEVPFHTAARIRNRAEVDDGVKDVKIRGIGHSSEEPSPYVYWFNEYLEQSNVLSSFTRRNYMVTSWNKRAAVAIPPNFQGPYTFNGRNVYDDNWLKVGKECLVLRKNLERAAGRHEPGSRFLPTLIEDIEQGERGFAPSTSIRPRPQVDFDPAKGGTFLLLDEFDMAWLKFLMEPGSAPGLIKYSNKSPQDNLLILFDHRIQTLFNDTHQNMFWAKTKCADDYKGFPSYKSQMVPLTELLAIINRGGRKLGKEKGHRVWTASDLNDHDTNPPNTLYQFTLEEARFACIKLARQGRLFYEGPILEDVDDYVNSIEWDQDKQCRFYKTNDLNDWGCVGMHKTEIFPEHRIIWRHESEEALRDFNQAYKKLVLGIFERDEDENLPKGFVPESVYKVGTYPEGGFEAARQSPIWEDIVPIDVAAAQELGLTERTIQFFRNLAYRLGRTIRHYQQVQKRSAKSPGLPRKELKAVSAQWREMVGDVATAAQQAGYKPIRFTRLTDVIPRASPGNPAANSADLTAIFTTIRKGLINDSVQNNTQTYPSRPCYEKNDRGVVVKTFQRQNVWGWADKTIREHHSPYLRKRYFDVRRWPLNRQSEATQKIIRTRKDEDICLQSPLAWYRYGIRVGPNKGARGPCENTIIDVLPATQQLAASQLVEKFKQALVVSMRNSNVSLVDEWEFIINPPLRDPWRLLSAGDTLEPIVRPTSKYIPGPPVFPMGDTLLKQIQISQELESILDPQPQNLGAKLLGKVTGWFSPEPDRIPLLPDIDENRAPRSNPRKRRLPPAFLSEIEPEPKVAALTDPFNDRIPARPRHLHDMRGPSSRRARPARPGPWSTANLANSLDTPEEKENIRRERVEAVATLLRGKVIDQVQLAASASEEVPAPPVWKVKSKTQDARKPDEVPTVEIVKNEEGASATTKVNLDLPKSKAEEGYVWPASVRRPRYSIVQDDGREIVMIDQDELGGLERAVRVPPSQWPVAEVAPPNIIVRVNPATQAQPQTFRPLTNPLMNPLTNTSTKPPTQDSTWLDFAKKTQPTAPSISLTSKDPSRSSSTSRRPSGSTSGTTTTRVSTTGTSTTGGITTATRVSTTGTSITGGTSITPGIPTTGGTPITDGTPITGGTSMITPPTSKTSSRRGSQSGTSSQSRTNSVSQTATGSAETCQVPTGQTVDVSGVPATDNNGDERHIITRGWIALQNQTFPTGYQAVPTSGRANHCGIHAMVISLRRQLPTLPGTMDVTYERLLALGSDPRVQARLADIDPNFTKGFDVNANFTVDLLAAMLEGWGMKYNVRLHLGLIFPRRNQGLVGHYEREPPERRELHRLDPQCRPEYEGGEGRHDPRGSHRGGH
ncbi:hypothetical protein PG993_006124 [Apiospora rasikravindrae]|uniref:Uncharacterized protein n=1 Tax=Apiospora rasikravindrae TaxID=990691 RepID=A0ABR1TAP8_9PEZI